MRPRVTDSVGDEFEARTLFFWAVLGVVGHLRRVCGALAAAPTRPTLTLADDDPPPAAGHEALYALLGIVSLARTVSANWRAVAPDRAGGAQEVARPDIRTVVRPRELLV